MDLKKMTAAAALSLLVATVPAMAMKSRVTSKPQTTEFNQEFARFDRNADGVITRNEFPADQSLFTRLDLNRDGVISRVEAQNALSNRGMLEDEVRRLDTNRDGRVSRSEWRGDRATFDRLDRNDDGVLSQADRQSRSGTSNPNTRFRGMDRNGDGMIARSEWRGNAQSFRQHDRNGDGVLSRTEVQAGGRKR